MEDEAGMVPLLAVTVDGLEVRSHALMGHAVSGEGLDLLVPGGQGLLVQPADLFIELLAGARARELDSDVTVRAEAGEEDELAGEIDDADGLAHVEHEDLAAVAHGRGLENELR